MSSVIEALPIAASVPAKAQVPARLAYLLSGYPACSLTFVLNEILGLKRLGFDIVTASINPCDRAPERMDEPERNEEANTFYVKRAGVAGVLKALAAAFFRQPLQTFRGLYFTLKLGGNFIRFFYFLEALVVGEWMRRSRRTHLHAHFGGAVASVAMIVARTFPVTLSLTVHGPDEFYDVEKFYLRQKIETASFICCISSFGRSQLMMLSPSPAWHKLLLARLGVDSNKFSRVRRPPGSGPLDIVCVGRLTGAKGQHILIAAFHRLLEEGRNVQLRLLGDGPERKSLEAAVAKLGIQGQVIFEGAVSANRVREALEDATIFSLPSFAEGIPIALMEAMAMEIPCVSTTISGIPELIRNEIDGLLVSPCDEVQLAGALGRLIDDPELRRQLGAAGKVRVQEQYDLNRSVQALGEIFQCRL